MIARRESNPAASTQADPLASRANETTTAPLTHATAEDDKRRDLSARWSNACLRLRAELGDAVFNAWFARLELDRIADGTAYLSVPTTFLKAWIQSHYNDKMLATLSTEAPEVKRLSIALRSSSRGRVAAAPVLTEKRAERPYDRGTESSPKPRQADDRRMPQADRPASSARPQDADHANDAPSGSPLDRRLTFASFLTGKSNQLAFAAAQRVAQALPGEPLLYSPLYIHAAVGLGKTHLIQAVAHAVADSGRRVIYLTAEKFMYGFVSSLRAQTAIAFKERLRAIDVLIIDDVQFLQGKSIQQEFCHTLNALIDDGRQVVVAADRPPGDLETLDERVRSRLAGGLCVEMEPLDEALRFKFLENRTLATRNVQPGFELSPQVIAYVAKSIVTNGRDLDGAVNRLMAHATLNGTPHTIETAEVAIRDLIRTREPKRVKIEDIQKLVATHYNVSRADILSSRRTATVVLPRQIAMYLSKSLTLRSLPEIGRRFGGRDHTTVLHAVRKIENLCGKEGTLAEELELLKRLLQD
ncbi:chromosomal replication initiator protein DnaA [Lichenihabitans sp. PAMC28606]|uniref:chromosomal replication initiator protein DnaA n=1 Tax=Lichenihabitans sp. PAMC28606 TaxID=2880932 RepID=UPI001D0B79EA|nr:chromosomal replication initiator protein DnaA [Lichenihabitans sp. PAMC28606]UDL95001.1 chromosomal replication initiator protein DnaA [Lichenihabitans sp. PAMC28606]